MKKIKVAIVGVGSISEVHLKSYASINEFEVYAFCDINKERLEYMGNKYGITRLYTDEKQMLEELAEIDAVDVCTWNAAHAPCSIMALEAGKHVFCEKPMAMNAKEAQAMKDAADKAGKVLMIGFVRRFGRDCELVKDFVDEGKLGDIYYTKATYLRRNGNPGGWFGNKELSGGGPLIDLGVHVIDMVRYLMGKPNPVAVYGVTFNKLGNRSDIKEIKEYTSVSAGKNDICNCEDLATALIRFDNGAVMLVEASFTLNIKKGDNSVQLFGTKGGTKIADEVELYTDFGGYLADVSFSGKTGLNGDKAFAAEMKNFADSINGISECRNPAEDGVLMMQILDAIYSSAECGHEVQIKLN